MFWCLFNAATASTMVEGDTVRVHYGDHGLVNDSNAAAGLQFRASPSDPWIDATWPRSRWMTAAVAYDGPAGESFTQASDDDRFAGWSVVSEGALPTTEPMYQVRYSAGELSIVRTDRLLDGRLVSHFLVTNEGAFALPNVRLAVGTSYDADVATEGSDTCETAGCAWQEQGALVDVDADGQVDGAVAQAVLSGRSLAIAPCHTGSVGFSTFSRDVDTFLGDPQEAVGDHTLHWRDAEGVLQPGETWITSVRFHFFPDGADLSALADLSDCDFADADGDGHPSIDAGGRDCDDTDPALHPGAAEVPHDGIDQDCDGADWTPVECYADLDEDGYGSTDIITSDDADCTDVGESTNAMDCDDTERSTHPGAAELPGDGVDQDCDGGDTPSVFEDTDGDGLSDGAEESFWFTNPFVADSDFDGLDDGHEVILYLTDPMDPDSDGDGLTDGREVQVAGTDPHSRDTDGDGLQDGEESGGGGGNESGTDPLLADTDGDGLDDYEEHVGITDPVRADTDEDGLSDGDEILVVGTDPRDQDTDNDTLSDGAEANEIGTDPHLRDTDGDGLDDGAELAQRDAAACPNPHLADSDGDGIPDGEEGFADDDEDGFPNACDPGDFLVELQPTGCSTAAGAGWLSWLVLAGLRRRRG